MPPQERWQMLAPASLIPINMTDRYASQLPGQVRSTTWGNISVNDLLCLICNNHHLKHLYIGMMFPSSFNLVLFPADMELRCILVCLFLIIFHNSERSSEKYVLLLKIIREATLPLSSSLGPQVIPVLFAGSELNMSQRWIWRSCVMLLLSCWAFLYPPLRSYPWLESPQQLYSFFQTLPGHLIWLHFLPSTENSISGWRTTLLHAGRETLCLSVPLTLDNCIKPPRCSPSMTQEWLSRYWLLQMYEKLRGKAYCIG